MVTFLEGTLLKPFDTFFVFLLMFIVIYAILAKVKVLGENEFINLVIAFVLSAILAMSNTATKTIAYATPWLVLILAIGVFTMLIFMFLGADMKDVPLNPTNPTTISILMILIVIIFMLAAGEVKKEQKAEATGDEIDSDQGAVLSFPGKVGAVLREPAVLGVIITMLIAVFAILMLASKPN